MDLCHSWTCISRGTEMACYTQWCTVNPPTQTKFWTTEVAIPPVTREVVLAAVLTMQKHTAMTVNNAGWRYCMSLDYQRKPLPEFIHQILSPETQLQQQHSDHTNTHGSTSLHTTCFWNHKPHSTWVQCQHQPQTTIILTSTTVKAEGPCEQIWQKLCQLLHPVWRLWNQIRGPNIQMLIHTANRTPTCSINE